MAQDNTPTTASTATATTPAASTTTAQTRPSNVTPIASGKTETKPAAKASKPARKPAKAKKPAAAKTAAKPAAKKASKPTARKATPARKSAAARKSTPARTASARTSARKATSAARTVAKSATRTAKSAARRATSTAKTATRAATATVKDVQTTARTAAKAANTTWGSFNPQALAFNLPTLGKAAQFGNNPFQSNMEDMMAKSQVNFEQFAQQASEQSKQGVEAVVKSANIWMKGCEDMMRTCMAVAQQASERNTDAFKSLMGCKTLNELTERQNELAQRTYDDMVTNATRLSEIGVKVATDTLAPLNDQISKAVKRATDLAA
jgi:phasin family protein